MGKQVNFYATKEEGAALIQEILDKFEAQAIKSNVKSTALFILVNISELDFNYIIPRGAMKKLAYKELPIQGYMINASDSEAIQFWRMPQDSNEQFLKLRFWFTSEPSALLVEKDTEYLKWADKILKFVRKKYTLYDKIMGLYLSPLALEATKNGLFKP